MDIRSLTCFIAVAEELHFHRAATRLHITQPALSQRISALEQEVGVALLERNRRGVQLTAAGTAFVDYARRAVHDAQAAKRNAQRAAQGETGRLELGYTVIASYGIVPAAVQRYREQYPLVTIELNEMMVPAQEAALTARQIDLGILHPPLDATGLATLALPGEELVLALPSTHRLAAVEPIPLEEIAGERLLIAPRRIGPRIYDQIIDACRNAGFTPTIAQEAAPMPTLIALVAAGAGVGFVARGLTVIRRPGIVYRELANPMPRLPVAAAWRDGDLPPPAARFLEVLASLVKPGEL